MINISKNIDITNGPNLCLQSEDLTTTWITYQGVINAGIETVPGGPVLSRFNTQPISGPHFPYQSIGAARNVFHNLSVFVKDDGAGFMGLCYYTAVGHYATIVVNLSTGAITDTDLGTSSGEVHSSGVDSYGNGVYRIWLGARTDHSAFVTAEPCPVDNGTPSYDVGGRPEFTAVDGEDILLGGVQLTVGTELLPYAVTTTTSASTSTKYSLNKNAPVSRNSGKGLGATRVAYGKNAVNKVALHK